MKSAAHSMSTPHLTLDEALAFYAHLGFDGVEILYTGDYRCALDPHATTTEVKALRDRLDGLGLGVAQITPYAKDFDVPDAADRRAAADEILRCVDLAAALGSKCVRLWAGNEPGPGEEARQFDRLVATLTELGKAAADAGVTLNIENHIGSHGITSANTVRIIETVGSPGIGITYDPGNLMMLGELDATEALQRQLPYIRHVHFKDLKAHGNRKHTPTLVGDGDVPWSDLMPTLLESGYSGYFSTEFEKRWHPEILPDSEAGLRHELAALKSLWAVAAR